VNVNASTLLAATGIGKRFGGVQALTDVSFSIRRGEIYGLIGPNGAGKTSLFNVLTGIYSPDDGNFTFDGAPLDRLKPNEVAERGIARTFQNIRLFQNLSALENVMIGGSVEGQASFIEALLALPRNRRDERRFAAKARALLAVVGLEALAEVRADRLQHSELRFIEIARALMLDPDFLLLDEPAAGLSNDEIARLAELIKAISARGIGVLLVEHHADLIFDICDYVTVLNLGRTLAAGTPTEIRVHKEVVSAYLGG